MSDRDIISRLCSSYFRMDSPIPYQVDVAGNITYMRWSDDDANPVFIRRVLISSYVTTNEFAYALWANRSTATYYYNLDNMS